MTSTLDFSAPTGSTPRMETAPGRTRRSFRLRHGAGFWVIAAAFLAVMAFSTIPTPLYAFYQARDGFPTWVVTVIFAAYAVGVIASLFLIGHLSDIAGRRRMVLIAVLIEIVSAALFLVWNDVAGLIVARTLSGIGVGALTASATAHLSELRAVARPDEGPATAGTVSTVVNTGGLALGPLIGGAFAQFLPEPLLLPYAVFLVVLAVAAVAVALVPETVERAEERPAYRPQRISLPAEARGAFSAAAVAAFAGFAVFGLFTSLAPSVLVVTLHQTSHLLAGFVPFAVFAASAISQIVFARVSSRAQLILALTLMLVGLAGLAAGVLTASFAVFLVSGVLAGAGVGLQFRSAIAAAASLAAPERRGEVLAAIFLIAYIGLAVPVLLVGVALIFWPLVPVLVVFVAAVAALSVPAGLRMLRRA
ncbi:MULTISPECIES: MFS transporter [unclassified Leifsonia]|uniref:MFS transporter n=1 Tax=unclassified Leifsonia TaxID=2663824 RepID=UPI00036B847C|nr:MULTISPECIES: MFS transporter [unclassified Leifsonia]TDP98568.1 putative MFS family arabinose efflux permease [Leifsonia sp. 115AMFTsu3.1]